MYRYSEYFISSKSYLPCKAILGKRGYCFRTDYPYGLPVQNVSVLYFYIKLSTAGLENINKSNKRSTCCVFVTKPPRVVGGHPSPPAGCYERRLSSGTSGQPFHIRQHLLLTGNTVWLQAYVGNSMLSSSNKRQRTLTQPHGVITVF